MVAGFVIPHSEPTIARMVIYSVDTTMHNHRLTVDVERNAMRFFDFMFDGFDSPAISDLGNLMFCKRFEAAHRLLKLDL